ncbi:hypothetical protein RhiJN_21666 [Ceratobasidium sp. AG-Ba]|nr:hypothetical protein RhiJN_21666 [Ceratobasidium sp. AG-Ba]
MSLVPTNQSSEVPYGYTRRFTRAKDSWKASADPRVVAFAQEGIDCIRTGGEPMIHELEAINSLPAHPLSLHLLNDRDFLQACIMRLYRLQQQDPLYPFAYSEGYLLFRAVVLTIGVMIVSRDPENYSFTLSELLKSRLELRDLTVLLLDFVYITAAKTTIGDSIFTPDSLIGWSTKESIQPWISRSDALLLLDVVWKSRKGFTRAWHETCAPAFFGPLFVLWRCIEIKSTIGQVEAFADIFHRYCTIAGGREQQGMNPIKDSFIPRMQDLRFMAGTYERVDLEDARLILKAYTSVILSTSPLYTIPSMEHLCYLLTYVVPPTGSMQGVGDLFFPLLRALFGYFWLTAAGKSGYEDGIVVEDIASTIHTT